MCVYVGQPLPVCSCTAVARWITNQWISPEWVQLWIDPLSGVPPAPPLSVTAAKLSWAMAGHSRLYGQVPPPWQLWWVSFPVHSSPIPMSHLQWLYEYCCFHIGCPWKFLPKNTLNFAHRHDLDLRIHDTHKKRKSSWTSFSQSTRKLQYAKD